VYPKPLPPKGDASSPSSGCTSGCTSKAETPNVGTVEAIAASLLTLSPEDRARLAAMLLGKPPGQAEGEAARTAADAPRARQTKADG